VISERKLDDREGSGIIATNGLTMLGSPVIALDACQISWITSRNQKLQNLGESCVTEELYHYG
jgi:hypothetical protein